mgnify:CR=1 FL=1
MSAILSVSPDEICLDSGMNESAFGKTNMSLQLSEDSGTLVEFDEAGSPVHYKPWHFSKIKTDRENGQVAFYGEGFTGIPLKTLFENGEVCRSVYHQRSKNHKENRTESTARSKGRLCSR